MQRTSARSVTVQIPTIRQNFRHYRGCLGIGFTKSGCGRHTECPPQCSSKRHAQKWDDMGIAEYLKNRGGKPTLLQRFDQASKPGSTLERRKPSMQCCRAFGRKIWPHG